MGQTLKVKVASKTIIQSVKRLDMGPVLGFVNGKTGRNKNWRVCPGGTDCTGDSQLAVGGHFTRVLVFYLPGHGVPCRHVDMHTHRIHFI